jgi:transposase
MAELRFTLESVNHLSVREIAEELERSEKSVWDMVGSRGIPARFQDGCSVRELAAKLHVRRPSIRTWIKADLLHKKRNGRIAEDSLQSFLHSHPERINWTLLDEDTKFWVSELLEAERIRVNGSGTRTRANSRSSDAMQAAEPSMSDSSASNTPEADPCEDPAWRNNRARGASPRR